jgi:iron complex transport system substrate-binding protein
MFSTIEQLGRVVGKRVQAADLAGRIRARLERIRATVGGRPRPRALLVFGREPATLRGLYVSGGRGFLHEMLETAGAANVFADVARESVQPSQETLLARAPDVIVEIHSGGLAPGGEANVRQVWSSLGSIPAVRDGRIHVLVGEELVVPGPRVAEATEALAKALHPEAFR